LNDLVKIAFFIIHEPASFSWSGQNIFCYRSLLPKCGLENSN